MRGLDGLGGRGGQLAGLDDRLELLGDRLLYKILTLKPEIFSIMKHLLILGRLKTR